MSAESKSNAVPPADLGDTIVTGFIGDPRGWTNKFVRPSLDDIALAISNIVWETYDGVGVVITPSGNLEDRLRDTVEDNLILPTLQDIRAAVRMACGSFWSFYEYDEPQNQVSFLLFFGAKPPATLVVPPTVRFAPQEESQ